jgi:hypothetical protein
VPDWVHNGTGCLKDESADRPVAPCDRLAGFFVAAQILEHRITWLRRNDKSRQVWFYRDWVVGAFNRDLGYDQFLTEQLAGDLLPNATQDHLVATGFLRHWPSGGQSNWGCGFLPTVNNGVLFRSSGEPVLFLDNPRGIDSQTQRESLDTLRQLSADRIT